MTPALAISRESWFIVAETDRRSTSAFIDSITLVLFCKAADIRSIRTCALISSATEPIWVLVV